MSEDKRYEMAKKRVEEIRSFYVHLFVYVIVNLGLFLINIIAFPKSLWFYWPLIGWGIGLFIHWFVAFIAEGVLGVHWEEKKINEIMEKNKSRKVNFE